ncbi:unnamed protein product [Alternaria burnsii]|nr:unnamed protein product [Alternaria burnsii]
MLDAKSRQDNRLSGTRLPKKRQRGFDNSKRSKQENLQNARERNVQPRRQDGKPTKKKQSVLHRKELESKKQKKSEAENLTNVTQVSTTATTGVGGTKLKVITPVRIAPDHYSSLQSSVPAATP